MIKPLTFEHFFPSVRHSPALKRIVKMMLLETIRNDDFQRNTALQHCSDVVLNGYNIVPAFQRCVALKIVAANHPV